MEQLPDVDGCPPGSIFGLDMSKWPNIGPVGVPCIVDDGGGFAPLQRDSYPVLETTLFTRKPKRQIGFTAKWD